MRIGVDASCWANGRGYGRYTRELLRSLIKLDGDDEYRLFIDTATAKETTDLPPDVEQVLVSTSRAASKAASADGRRSLRDLWAMRRAVDKHGQDLDLFYFPSVYTFFPVKTPAKVVVTIHDTTAEKYPKLIFPNWRARLAWRLKLNFALRTADVIATVSHASKRQITDVFNVVEDRVCVVPDAVGPEFYKEDDPALVAATLAKYGVDPAHPIVLYVGGISPHKNLPTLVEAHAALVGDPETSDVKLVLAGDYQKDVFYSGYTELRAEIDRFGVADSVIFTGFVADADLPLLYNGATVLAMPSYDEGFGLPALEAMACGTPVVASRAGALPEVVGDAGLLFSPHDAQELRRTLAKVISDDAVRVEMSRNGLARASQFSWEQSARLALEAFRVAVEGKVRAAA